MEQLKHTAIMTDEQIRQNSESYAKQFLEPYDAEYAPIKHITAQMAFIAGAHSRDEEINDLQLAYNNLVNSFNERGRELAKASQELDKLRNPWRDAKKDPPKEWENVFVMMSTGTPTCGYREDDDYHLDADYLRGEVAYWMPIPELKGGNG